MESESGATPEQATVLVVDDDVSIRRLIIAALKRGGAYRFLEAANGAEALDFLRSEPVGVVVLDLMMPVVSGWDVLMARQDDDRLRNIPVIVVSATRGPEIADAVSRGICAYLPKPFDVSALGSLVRGCLASGDQTP